MPTEKELVMYQKATIYDIIRLITKDGLDKNYTARELQELLNAYADRLEQK